MELLNLNIGDLVSSLLKSKKQTTVQTATPPEPANNEPITPVETIDEQEVQEVETTPVTPVQTTPVQTVKTGSFTVPDKKVHSKKVDTSKIYTKKSTVPYNGITGKMYKGRNVNILLDEMKKRKSTDCRFLTWNQLKECGLRVKKGSKSIALTWYGTGIDEIDNGDTERTNEPLKIKSYFRVFHASDITGIPEVK